MNLFSKALLLVLILSVEQFWYEKPILNETNKEVVSINKILKQGYKYN